jgi:hypothetical protein
MSKLPPIPPDQKSDKIGADSSPATRDAEVSRDPARDRSQTNLKEQGAAGNLRQNTTHSGNIQGR